MVYKEPFLFIILIEIDASKYVVFWGRLAKYLAGGNLFLLLKMSQGQKKVINVELQIASSTVIPCLPSLHVCGTHMQVGGGV